MGGEVDELEVGAENISNSDCPLVPIVKDAAIFSPSMFPIISSSCPTDGEDEREKDWTTF